jgi:hypothetical protein
MASPLRVCSSLSRIQEFAALNQEARVLHVRYTPAKPHIWKVAYATRTTNFITLSGNSKMRGEVPPNCGSCSSALEVQPRAM